MAVPRMAQLRKGVAVNVVLKADQRSGKLTTGSISNILTRGDHPRGIKVRLTGGQIGRVQSLAPPHEVSGSQSIARTAADIVPENNSMHPTRSRHLQAEHVGKGGRGFQADQWFDRAPQESLSLFDYVRMPSSTAKTVTSDVTEITSQEQLQAEFPKLESTLITAILLDYSEVAEARKVLSSLS